MAVGSNCLVLTVSRGDFVGGLEIVSVPRRCFVRSPGMIATLPVIAGKMKSKDGFKTPDSTRAAPFAVPLWASTL